jgi:hypothetical protein
VIWACSYSLVFASRYDFVCGWTDDASLNHLHFRLETDGCLNDFLRVYIREEKQALDITHTLIFTWSRLWMRSQNLNEALKFKNVGSCCFYGQFNSCNAYINTRVHALRKKNCPSKQQDPKFYCWSSWNESIVSSVGRKAGRPGPRFWAKLPRLSILYGVLIKGVIFELLW